MSYEAFAYYYDSLMDQEFYNDYIQFINKHVKKYQTVLELGCGTGEIAIRLAHLGKNVCATDISKDMLEVAKYKCIDFKADVMLSRVDMCDFAVDTKLDLILCLCDSLNYVTNLKDVKNVFQNTYDALKKDGTFIFDVDSMYKMEKILANYDEENDDEDFYFHCDETKLNKIASWLYETDRHGYPILGNVLIIGEKYGNAGIEFCEMSEEQFDLVFPKLKELGKRFKDAGD